MESMVELFGGVYRGKRVFITGHTGFKGSWLALWLQRLGAVTRGFSIDIPTTPSHHALLNPEDSGEFGDIRDFAKLKNEIERFRPHVVFHLAAQPLVCCSYENPLETLTTNIIGTANLLEALRGMEGVEAVLNITSDKCYKNSQDGAAFKECDPLGGDDIYSASKACSEIITNSYKKSFLHKLPLITCRAGNVIGGGDWAANRLFCDIARAYEQKKPLKIKNPGFSRPWQFVLEPLAGYLRAGELLIKGDSSLSSAYNFGTLERSWKVREIAALACTKLGVEYEFTQGSYDEARLLALDCSRAKEELGFTHILDTKEAVEMSAAWYEEYYKKSRVISSAQLEDYVAKAKAKGAIWSGRGD